MRGQAIAQVESNVRRLDATEYRVKSQSGNGEYQVVSTEAGWFCSCPDAITRVIKCKHIFAVELSLEIRRRIENSKRIVPLDYQSCLVCGSKSIVKHGLLHNKSGDLQRYSCRECGKRFTLNLGFERMRATPKVITTAMQLYFTGESLRNVQKFLRLQGVQVSHVSILNWIRKYTKLMEEFTDKLLPQVSDTWRADEIYVKVKGNMKYLFSMMDDESRYWLAEKVYGQKEGANASRLFIKARQVAGKEPKTLITDHLPSYAQAAAFDYPHTVHKREIALGGIIHNNKMERMNGEIRDREKTMRGVKRADSPVLSGMRIYHNFVRPHEALDGRTPAEAAGIQVSGSNKWLTLIQNAAHVQSLNTEESQA